MQKVNLRAVSASLIFLSFFLSFIPSAYAASEMQWLALVHYRPQWFGG